MKPSRWQKAYRIYQAMRRRSTWSPPVTPGTENAEAFVLDRLSKNLSRPLANVLSELAGSRLICPREWKPRVRKLYGMIQAIDGATQEFEDAFQAALYIVTMRSAYWWEDGERRAYRGQGAPYPLRPKFFRHEFYPDAAKWVARLASFSSALGKKHPEFTEEQRLAIAQHYSARDEACLATWLLDLTWDPLVALFFATLPQVTPGDIGVVTLFETRTWNEFGAGGGNPLGTIRLIRVDSVPRIHAQKAVFLIGAHPSLIEQYVTVEIRFVQRKDVIFEDETAGVTREVLLPSVDPYLDFARAWGRRSPRFASRPLQVSPPADPNRRLTALDYRDIAQSWIDYQGKRLPPKASPLLDDICSFHATCQTIPELWPSKRSLRKLRACVDALLLGVSSGGSPDLNSLIRQAYPDAVRQMGLS